jgi:hypothetical protein
MLILTLGIVGLVCSVIVFCLPLPLIGCVLSIIAWSLGTGDLRKMDRGEMDPEGHGSTMAGYVCGIIGTIISLMYLVACGLYMTFILTVASNMGAPGPGPVVKPPIIRPAPGIRPGR